jgi:hydroxymethylglutaryl-CoA lyase/(R)-citramalyl-CoA lyase
MSRRIAIVDVAPRDGLQMEPTVLDPEVRAELVRRLASAGVSRIEITSFVNAAKVPQMAFPEEVVAAVEQLPGVDYSGLVLNERGYTRLAETPLAGVNFSFAITDSYNQRNQGQTVEESVAAVTRVVKSAHEAGRHIAVTFAVAFGCPFEGRVEPSWVHEVARRILEAGPDELILADTIGVATPTRVRELVGELAATGTPIGVHLHNTRNTGFANAYSALTAGASRLDACVGGIGGCPFAPRATGNIATEDLVYLLDEEGIDTGIDLDALINVAAWLEGLLGRQLEGQVYRAGGFPSPVV